MNYCCLCSCKYVKFAYAIILDSDMSIYLKECTDFILSCSTFTEENKLLKTGNQIRSRIFSPK